MHSVIDVSENQGKIDWSKVKIDAAIIRIGYRGYGNAGTLVTDKQFKANMDGATKYKIPIGVYWFSTAVSDDEATQEVRYVLNLLKPYKITLPVYLDSEDASPGVTDNRLDKLNKTRLTQYGLTFCRGIKAAGYTPGLYCSESWFTSRLDGEAFRAMGCSIWMAKYSSKSPKYKHDAWQYTSSGTMSGISGRVDFSYFYTNYLEDNMKFTDVPSNHWAYNYIDKVSDAGIMVGLGDGRFAPDQPITRAQMAKILVEAGIVK